MGLPGSVPMNLYELAYWTQAELVVGIDEAGRGPMAGPLVVCGVVLPIDYENPLINDSKKLSEKQRRQLFEAIKVDALEIVIEIVSPKQIDILNIYQATKQAMETIINRIERPALIDAMVCDANYPSTSIIKGDQKSISIAAASIVAKCVRDQIMMNYDTLYPNYHFGKHKGYPTRHHKEAMEAYGLSPIHRRSFGFKTKT